MLSRGIFLAIPLPNSGTLGHARVYGQVSTLEQVGVAMPLTNFQDLEQTMTPSDPISPTTNRQPPIAPFLRAMLDILMKEDQTIVRWTADGNAFEIVDMDGLTEYLLPRSRQPCRIILMTQHRCPSSWSHRMPVLLKQHLFQELISQGKKDFFTALLQTTM